MADLEAQLKEAADARFRLIATDGVFSMDGIIANLPGICDLADKYDALVMVDDSHAVGFIGDDGRGTPEYHGVMDRVDIVTGTLGKALGGASRRLHQRPQARSSSCCASGRGRTCSPTRWRRSSRRRRWPCWSCSTESTRLRDRLAANTRYFRAGDDRSGLRRSPGEHPIVPIMLGDAVLAARDGRRACWSEAST